MFIFIRSMAVLALAVLISCGTKEVPPAAKWTPGISQTLPRNAATTSSVIDNIGSVSNPAAQKSVEVSGATQFGITGWAIDEPNKAVAGGVDAVIDQAPYSAHYGSARPDVATHFSNPAYGNSGYELMVAPGQLSKGPHSVSIRIIASDKKSFYQGPVVQFLVN
jgi:predicted small lipoprotein YifL